MSKKEFKLSSPWMTYYHEIEALFGEDPAIKVSFDNDEKIIKLYVIGDEKAEALTQILPAKKEFGNVTVSINIIPANQFNESKVSLFQKAFEGNPVVDAIKTLVVFNAPVTYIIFKNKVVQFFNDDISDINGNKSTLYQDIADDIFENHNGIFFCTDTEA